MREGDPLEIFTGHDGEIIFKKYSIMAELSEFSQSYADSLYKVSGLQCIIFDSDRVIACTGSGRKDVIGLAASKEVEELLSGRTSYFRQFATEKPLYPFSRSEYCLVGAIPIIAAGDGVGVVTLVGSVTDTITDAQKKLWYLQVHFLQIILKFRGILCVPTKISTIKWSERHPLNHIF